MDYDEVWSFPYDQIEAYLIKCGAQKGVTRGSVYMVPSCCIEIEALPQRRVAGNLCLPQTRVRMKGAGAEEFHHGFQLFFLKGGA